MIMKKLFVFAAIILAAVACTKAEPENNIIENNGQGIPFSARISGNTLTKALADAGSTLTATWAVNEEVALIYNDGTAHKDVMRVESITDGVAFITGSLSGTPADNTDVTVIYPASAANGTTGEIKSNLLKTAQVGTLADIAANYDVRIGTGKLAVGGTATFKSNVTLANQFAIVKFTVKNDGSNIPVKPLVVTINAVDYSISPASATDVLYVALPAIDAKAVSFTATKDAVKYYCSKPSVTFAAGSFYRATLNMSSQLGLPGQFSVSATKKVTFSQGNLQWFYGGNTHKIYEDGNDLINDTYSYNGGVFTFADHQWDICGDNNYGGYRSVDNIAAHIDDYTSTHRIDLFVYASSGKYVGYRYVFHPFFANRDDHWPGASLRYGPDDSDISKTFHDWGYFNAILNGGDKMGMWRTLTKSEWAYLMNERADATSKRGFATVNGVRGIILLPDSWSGADITAVANLVTTDNSDAPAYDYAAAHWGDNTYDESGWAAMEAAGAVFLPAAGTLNPSDCVVRYHNVSNGGAAVSYWTSSYNPDVVPAAEIYKYAYAFDLGTADGKYSNWRFDNSSRAFGRAVRLVRDVE